jgi:hypothetical protein
VPIQSADAHASATRDFFERYACADLRKGTLRGFDEQQAIASPIRTGFARLGGGRLGFSFGVDRRAP